MDYLAHLIKNAVFLLVAMRFMAVMVIIYVAYRLLQHANIARWFKGSSHNRH